VIGELLFMLFSEKYMYGWEKKDEEERGGEEEGEGEGEIVPR